VSGSVLDSINDGQVLGRVFHRRHCSSHYSKHSTDSVHSVVMFSKRGRQTKSVNVTVPEERSATAIGYK